MPDLINDLHEAVRRIAAPNNSARQIAQTMPQLVHATSVLPLSNLVQWERIIRDELSLARYRAEQSRNRRWPSWLTFHRLTKPWDSDRRLTWVDLSSFNGYDREQALRTLAGAVPNGFFFALIIRRLNDWVPQVRTAARDTIREFARTSAPEHVADALCAILPAWPSWRRMQTQDRQLVTELFTLPPISAELIRRVKTAATGPMQAVLSQVLRIDVIDDDLIDIATNAVQPAVRAKAYSTLLQGKAAWVEGSHWQWTDVRYCIGRWQPILGERPLHRRPALVELLNAAALDRSGMVRRVAAEALVREMHHLGEIALVLARQLANDRSPPVAKRGEFVLQRLVSPSKLRAKATLADANN